MTVPIFYHRQDLVYFSIYFSYAVVDRHLQIVILGYFWIKLTQKPEKGVVDFLKFYFKVKPLSMSTIGTNYLIYKG